MKKSKMAQMFSLYAENPNLTNEEGARAVDVSSDALRMMKHRLIAAGYLKPESDGSVSVLKEFRARPANTTSVFKAAIYEEMVEAYMEDFRQQATFADRLSVGREIRLILEKM